MRTGRASRAIVRGRVRSPSVRSWYHGGQPARAFNTAFSGQTHPSTGPSTCTRPATMASIAACSGVVNRGGPGRFLHPLTRILLFRSGRSGASAWSKPLALCTRQSPQPKGRRHQLVSPPTVMLRAGVRAPLPPAHVHGRHRCVTCPTARHTARRGAALYNMV